MYVNYTVIHITCMPCGRGRMILGPSAHYITAACECHVVDVYTAHSTQYTVDI